MAWWMWLLIGWPVLAIAVALVLGGVIRLAERRRGRAGEGADWDVA